MRYKGHEGEYKKTELPDKNTRQLLWNEVSTVWSDLIRGIDIFANALSDHSVGGKKVRIEIRNEYLLGKPIGQRVVAVAFLQLTTQGKLSADEACSRLNQVNWRIDDEMWENVLTRDRKRVLAGPSAIKLGVDFVTYLTGRGMSQNELLDLRQRISPDNDRYRLPKRVCALIEDWKPL